MRCAVTPKLIGVGFEPTPPKRPVPETGALDRSAIQPPWCWFMPACVRRLKTVFCLFFLRPSQQSRISKSKNTPPAPV